MLTRNGGGRATGDISALRGKAVRVFAQCWAMGYLANCERFEREGMLEEDQEV